MLENWDQNLGRKQGNHKYGGIFETRNREGQWKIISVKAKFEVIGVDKPSLTQCSLCQGPLFPPINGSILQRSVFSLLPFLLSFLPEALSRRIKLVQCLGSQEEKPAARVSNAAMRWGCKKPWPTDSVGHLWGRHKNLQKGWSRSQIPGMRWRHRGQQSRLCMSRPA